MQKIIRVVLLASVLLLAPVAAMATDNGSPNMRSGRGVVPVTGKFITVPDLSSGQKLRSLIIVNNDDTDTLLVAINVAAADATAMPAPDADIAVGGVVTPISPGQSFSIPPRTKTFGLRGETGDVDAVWVAMFE